MARAAGPRKELGTRYTCFACGAKFYDLHRPVPTCPKCEADQREDPELAQVKQTPTSFRKAPPKRRPVAEIEPEDVVPVDEPRDNDDDDLVGPEFDDDALEEEEIG